MLIMNILESCVIKQAPVDNGFDPVRRNLLKSFWQIALVLGTWVPFELEAKNKPDLSLIFRGQIAPPWWHWDVLRVNNELIYRWKQRYLGLDKEYEEFQIRKYWRNNVPLYMKLISWWKRFEKHDLWIVLNACARHGVPREAVFLALWESHWDRNCVSSAGAKWYWQFMRSTAKLYRLKINGRIDERLDVIKSTEAAMRLLKDLYQLTEIWCNLYWIDPKLLSESDKWSFAFWAYNMSPDKVKRIFWKCRWRSAEYALRCDNEESRKYVHKLYWIKEAVMEMKAAKII